MPANRMPAQPTQSSSAPQTLTKAKRASPPYVPPTIVATMPALPSERRDGLIWLMFFLMAIVWIVSQQSLLLTTIAAALLIYFWSTSRGREVQTEMHQSQYDDIVSIIDDPATPAEIERMFNSVFAFSTDLDKKRIIDFYSKNAIDQYAAMKAAIDDRRLDEERN